MDHFVTCFVFSKYGVAIPFIQASGVIYLCCYIPNYINNRLFQNISLYKIRAVPTLEDAISKKIIIKFIKKKLQ